MMNTLFTVAMALVTLGILVTIHEFGHYWVARRCGVRVLRFAVGFGQPLLTWRDRHDTEFSLCAIPLGGYVKMLDERDGDQSASSVDDAFNQKPVRHKLAIVAAGPAANFLLAIVVLFFLFLRGQSDLVPIVEAVQPNSVAASAGLEVGQEVVAVDGADTKTLSAVRFALLKRLGDTGTIDLSVVRGLSERASVVSIPINQWLSDIEEPDPITALGIAFSVLPETPQVGSVTADSPASLAGFEPSDLIIRADDVDIVRWMDFVDYVRARPGVPISVLVERGADTKRLSVTPETSLRNGETVGSVGMAVFLPEIPENRIRYTSRGPVEALGAAIERTWSLTLFTFESMWKMLQGLISTKNLSGPISIAQVAAQTAESGFITWLSFLALLSISLGAINLLPIPILDGGHIVFHAFEGIFGRPVPESIQIMSYQIGLMAVFSLMVFAIYNDVARL